MYKIEFLPEVNNDLEKFDYSVKIKIFKKLELIAQNPEIWKDLWNKLWFDLSWLKKMYVDNKKIRIVYKVTHYEIKVLIISIWKRENEKVYKEAFKRIIK